MVDLVLVRLAALDNLNRVNHLQEVVCSDNLSLVNHQLAVVCLVSSKIANNSQVVQDLEVVDWVDSANKTNQRHLVLVDSDLPTLVVPVVDLVQVLVLALVALVKTNQTPAPLVLLAADYLVDSRTNNSSHLLVDLALEVVDLALAKTANNSSHNNQRNSSSHRVDSTLAVV